MAPFMVGDFIEYAGFWSRDRSELIVFEIVAWNVQITTTGAPTYIRVEETLIGVYTSDTSGEVAETRFVGYASDPTVTVSINAIDIDPCTGEETNRPYGVGQWRPEAGGRNKWLSRIDGDVTGSIYTREYRAIASSGTVVTKNGLVAGQYAAPILEWIQPELLVPGNEPLVNQYGAMAHLTQGVGPDEDGNIFGPLDPFPQSGVTVFNVSTCGTAGGGGGGGDPSGPQTAAARITASLGSVTTTSRLFVRSDDTFTLNGFQDNSDDPIFGNDTLTWRWSVVDAESADTQANLATFMRGTNNRTVTVKFASSAPTGDYVFQLAIDSAGQATTGTATFTVNFFTGPDTVTVEAVTWTSSQSGTLGVTCKSNYLVSAKVGMSVTYPGDRGATTSTMTASPPGSGLWSFSTRDVDRPGTITCRSLLGGTASRSGTTAKRDLADAASAPARKRLPRPRIARRSIQVTS